MDGSVCPSHSRYNIILLDQLSYLMRKFYKIATLQDASYRTLYKNLIRARLQNPQYHCVELLACKVITYLHSM